MTMRAFETDAFLSSAVRVEWMDDTIPARVRDDLERAVAEKCVPILEAARFTHNLLEQTGTEVEARVWLEAATWPAFVNVQPDPRRGKHYFLLMDDQARERLAALVFDRVPSVTAADAREESRLFFEAVSQAFTGNEEVEAGEFIDRIQQKVREIDARDAVGR